MRVSLKPASVSKEGLLGIFGQKESDRPVGALLWLKTGEAVAVVSDVDDGLPRMISMADLVITDTSIPPDWHVGEGSEEFGVAMVLGYRDLASGGTRALAGLESYAPKAVDAFYASVSGGTGDGGEG